MVIQENWGSPDTKCRMMMRGCRRGNQVLLPHRIELLTLEGESEQASEQVCFSVEEKQEKEKNAS